MITRRCSTCNKLVHQLDDFTGNIDIVCGECKKQILTAVERNNMSEEDKLIEIIFKYRDEHYLPLTYDQVVSFVRYLIKNNVMIET